MGLLAQPSLSPEREDLCNDNTSLFSSVLKKESRCAEIGTRNFGNQHSSVSSQFVLCGYMFTRVQMAKVVGLQAPGSRLQALV